MTIERSLNYYVRKLTDNLLCKCHFISLTLNNIQQMYVKVQQLENCRLLSAFKVNNKVTRGMSKKVF